MCKLHIYRKREKSAVIPRTEFIELAESCLFLDLLAYLCHVYSLIVIELLRQFYCILFFMNEKVFIHITLEHFQPWM